MTQNQLFVVIFFIFFSEAIPIYFYSRILFALTNLFLISMEIGCNVFSDSRRSQAIFPF